MDVNLLCKSNKSFLYERNIGLKCDMVQFSRVKIFRQNNRFTAPAPKAQRQEVANVLKEVIKKIY